MRKLLLQCECGQRMQVPRTAVGKMGMCPSCGKTVRITEANTSPRPDRPSRPSGRTRRGWWRGGNQPSEDAKQRFGQAVDLYSQGRYGEALAVLESLATQYPNDPNIERGRAHCMNAMRRPRLAQRIPQEATMLPDQRELNEETVRRVVLEKLLHGTDEVQLQAAELAARLLGIQGRANGREQAATPGDSPADAPPMPDNASPTDAEHNDESECGYAAGEESQEGAGGQTGFPNSTA